MADNHTSKRHVSSQHSPRIDGDLAALEVVRNSMRTGKILCENGGGQAILGIVGFLNDIFFVMEFGDGL